MSYFVTGATGFIGKYLVSRLLEREGKVYVLVRPQSMDKLDGLRASWGEQAERVIPIPGELGESNLGVKPADLKMLRGKIDHLFHLAAVYSLKTDGSDESQDIANIVGTDHALELAREVRAGCFHHMSSIAAAGLYPGIFREDMFEEAEGLDHPYFRTKHEAEVLVRTKCKVPWRIYRPGMVVGHSQTGEIDKIDGPYYFFKMIQKMRQALPSWMPTIGLEGGYVNVVPVDYVVAAMDHIAHAEGQDGKCFHLIDSQPRHVGEALNLFARVAHAPQLSIRIDARMFAFVPAAIKQAVAALKPIQRVVDQILKDLDIPKDLMQLINYPTRFDDREARRLLDPAGIHLPDLDDYAWRLWDYWERHLDPDLFVDRTLSGTVRERIVMVTGASSGIGKATATRLAAAGAKVLLVARGMEKLKETQAQIEADGGFARVYVCDLTDMDACDKLVGSVLEEFGRLDVLINNAGRSIRRSISLSYDRFHDFERLMQLNYFGALRLTLGFLPAMAAQRSGHVIHISSIGVLSNAPRFSAYVASKAAMDAFVRCAAAEFTDQGVSFTTVNMPLVRTPMIAPTAIYRSMPTISPEEAADKISEAIIHKPQRIATRLGIFAQIVHLVVPKIAEVIMNTAFRMFPDSAVAKGVKEEEMKPSKEQIAFASLMRGIHW